MTFEPTFDQMPLILTPSLGFLKGCRTLTAQPYGMIWKMSFYKHHVFFCTNQREDCKACCENFSSAEMRSYAKQQIKSLGLNGSGGIRINTAGCLDRCEEGPVIAVYPEAIWYSWLDKSDIDEIIEQHLVKGKPVKRLMLD